MTEPQEVLGTATTLRQPTRVLLIGRDYRNAATLAEHLINDGYVIISELDVARAATRLRSAKFGFVLIDIDVTGAAGLAFIEMLRADEQLAGSPILAISLSDNMESIERSLQAGADDYVPNICGPGVLRARVNAALERRRHHRVVGHGQPHPGAVEKLLRHLHPIFLHE